MQGNGNLNCILKDVGIGIKFKPDTLTQNDKTFIKLNKLKMLVTTEKLVYQRSTQLDASNEFLVLLQTLHPLVELVQR